MRFLQYYLPVRVATPNGRRYSVTAFYLSARQQIGDGEGGGRHCYGCRPQLAGNGGGEPGMAPEMGRAHELIATSRHDPTWRRLL